VIKINLFFILILFNFSFAQEKTTLYGLVSSEKVGLSKVSIAITNTSYTSQTDSLGNYKIQNIPPGSYKIRVTASGYEAIRKTIVIQNAEKTKMDFELSSTENQLNEIVVSGTLKAVKRLESAVPVEVYSPIFFKKNPTASIYEALQNVNGVRPQLNCGVCNTGDIHINGLEGPYTLVLID